MTHDEKLWQTKLAARIHDPAEKALVLLRDRAGHEGGSVKELKAVLPVEGADTRAVKQADWWASAADRPQWPKDQWARVHWTSKPVLIHPVSGAEIDLTATGSLRETELGDIKARSFDHFKRLAEAVHGDLKKTLLAFWRCGPELVEEEDFGKLGALWEQLPADTRVPDHSIWEHLDLTSAFAGAMATDPEGEVTLLALSIGPVQPFIASARTTSDLWAGSHLLARLAWETMKPLCSELGPDAVLFPRLRGVPQVDLWLKDECGLPDALFEKAPWKKGGTDANPLFAAALPNRFVAVVPASRARELAQQCERAARGWLRKTGRAVLEKLLKEAGDEIHDDLYCCEQLRRQLEGFPEVHWAAVPFTLIRPRDTDRQTDLDVAELSVAMAPFFHGTPEKPGGFLDSEAWQVLRDEIQLEEGLSFYRPNPGVLYPAIYELAERVLAAAKSVRAFGQTEEQGWRCSLSGETEWLTTDESQLKIPPGQRRNTLWTKVAAKRPAWAKEGEHLGALPAIKRLWPTLFAEEVGKALGQQIGRFVVSTHTVALAHQLDQWLEYGGLTAEDFQRLASEERVALPQRLMLRHVKAQPQALKDAAALLAMMERAQESNDEREAEGLRRVVRESLKKRGNESDSFRLETYYGLLMMDGDRMGRILSGEDEHTPSYRKGFSPQVRDGFDQRAKYNPRLKRYGDQKRAISPGRHMAISGALNDFSLHLAPHIVQREYLGRLIYAGGDDVLAMLPVADLLPAAARLRDGWSGVKRPDLVDDGDSWRGRLQLDKGYARLDGQLLRLMGEHASASAGLVVAHHQAPLPRVLREVRAAEKAAKEEGGRDAFQVRVIKRSGGALRLTLKWGQLGLLERLIEFLRDPAVSRRAVYHSVTWLRDLPEPEGDGRMLAELLAYQLQRQSGHAESSSLARDLVALTVAQPANRRKWLENLLSVAEFLARETRQPAGGRASQSTESKGAAT